MKKFLPLILLAVGALVFIGALVMVKGKKNTTVTPADTDDEVVAEIPFVERPFTTLTPTSDGHWLTLNIGDIKVKNAASIDYELLYKTKTGTTQGVPGTIKLDGGKIEERKLLLGSESSGKFRYDEGVADGTLTFRFRSDRGKLVGKLTTDFHLQTGTTSLTSKDGKFIFTLGKAAKVYFLTMNTFGLPSTVNKTAKEGPYGVFSSDKTVYAGKATIGGAEAESVNGMNVFFTAN